MTTQCKRGLALFAGAALLAAGAAWGDKLDPRSVEQFQTQLNMAMQGNADAQYRVGEMYELGLGTQRDSGMAFLWFNKASMQGNALAKDKLAAMDMKTKAEAAQEQDRVNAAMRALQQQQEQELARQRAAAEAARNRQGEDAARQKAAAEAAAAAKAKAEATAKAEAAKAEAAKAEAAKAEAARAAAARPAPAPAAGTPAPAAAKPTAKKEGEAEFTANPCKGPQAKFLSTCQ